MRKTAIITIILSLISLSSNVFAQDNIPEDFFKWFPKGQYESITHYSPILMKQEKAFKDYDETFNGISVRYHYGIPLPQAMMEACDGYTKGKLVKVKVEKLGETEEGFRPASPGGLSAQADIGGIAYQFSGMGDDILVVRFNDLITLIREEEKKGNLVKLDEQIGDFPLYSFLYKEPRWGSDYEYYFVRTPFDELLISNSKETLLKMFKAGSGVAENILSNQEYMLLTENMDKFSQSWEMANFKLFTRVIQEFAEKQGASMEEIRKREATIDKAMEFNITGLLLSDKITMVDINVYPSKEAAKKAFDEGSSNYDNKNFSLDGFLTIGKDVFTVERIKGMKAQVAEYKEKLEEKAKQKNNRAK